MQLQGRVAICHCKLKSELAELQIPLNPGIKYSRYASRVTCHDCFVLRVMISSDRDLSTSKKGSTLNYQLRENNFGDRCK